jgi:hypothetical protein
MTAISALPVGEAVRVSRSATSIGLRASWVPSRPSSAAVVSRSAATSSALAYRAAHSATPAATVLAPLPPRAPATVIVGS